MKKKKLLLSLRNVAKNKRKGIFWNFLDQPWSFSYIQAHLDVLIGVFTSSNFPDKYNQNEQCGFLIKGPDNSRIRLQFTNYQINKTATFGVFDGTSSPYGGIYTPFPVDTEGKKIEFTFNKQAWKKLSE